MDAFGPATRAWFEASFAAPTEVQRRGWPRIAAGEHALLIAPTGSGKTLAAFLSAIDRLSREMVTVPLDAPPGGRGGVDAPPGGRGDVTAPPGVRVLYVSPLKALVYDVERNLRAPLVGLRRFAERAGLALRLPEVAVRTGDTPQAERRSQARSPAPILVTTPESLYLILGSAQRETLRTVDTVIVDEIHSLAPTKRGAHLALSLERLAALTDVDPQRIGLSATATPLSEVARYLGGDRPVAVADTSARPHLDLRVVVPVPDMTRPDAGAPGEADGDAPAAPGDGDDAPARPGGAILGELLGPSDAERRTSVWPAIHPRLLELIRAHRTTLVFVNSRGLCERLAQRLNELAGGEEELVRAHHGSLSHARRREVEEALKAGAIKGLVATSSLELGIDMGAVDLVILVESPGSVASGLQRVGRAGHQVGEISRGRVFPKHRGDLLEATVVGRAMREGAIEPLRLPRSPLDVLAQQIVADVSVAPSTVERLAAMVRRSASYRELSDELLAGVLDMLSGRYPSTELADLRPRVIWDREAGLVSGRRGSRALAAMSGGTIPDRGLYTVHIVGGEGGAGGPRIGELDEEMVHESRTGQTFMLGASTWRIQEITRDRVLVSPAPGQPGRLPFWRGDGPGRPLALGRAIGAFTRELGERLAADRAAAEAWLEADYGLDAFAARNLAAYVAEQREATGTLPTDRHVTVERFRDELGDWRVCLLTPFGARVHAPWALALEARLGARAGFEVQALHTDDGIVLRFVDADEAPDVEALLPDPEEVEDLVVEQLGHSALFAGQFRENAARALLLPRRRPGSRTPLWQQRMKAQTLLAVARRYPSFPIILETYRSCLQDVFDVPALKELLAQVRRREVRVDAVETPAASPFARSLVFAFVNTWLYEGDAPLAERKAQALTLDRTMLRELLGHEALRELLDAAVVDELEAELQGLAEDRRAHHADGLHDLLRRVGDLAEAEVAARCTADPGPWLEELRATRRAAPIRLAGEARWIALEDCGLYRDAIGALPPPAVPAAFLEPVPDALEALLGRYARTHGPFLTRQAAARWDLRPGQVEAGLRLLEARDRLLHGDFHPGGTEREWCDPEVLRRLRQRTLARLRNEVAPVEAAVLARFLPAWHGVGGGARGPWRLAEVVDQLEGLPLSFKELERAVLPARVADFHPRLLDELGAMGQIVWVGHGSLGARDGRVALYRRERVGLLLEPPAPWDPPTPLHAALLAHLEARGASFAAELALACGRPPEAELIGALADLAWAGLVTNDTFAPLRAFTAAAAPRREGPRRGRRGGAPSPALGGRWALVSGLLGPPPSDTEKAHARALTLLERHGLVARDVLAIEALSGGFTAIYGVLKAMEEAGQVRRGWFVEGLGGAQFAYPGAVDRLRAARTPPDVPAVHALVATDPAQPYGAALPWPPLAEGAGGGPRRAAGAWVVLVDGEAALYLDRGGRRLLTFPAAADPHVLRLAAAGLRPVARTRRGRLLRVEEIDGEPARTSPLAARLREAAFTADHAGLLLAAD